MPDLTDAKKALIAAEVALEGAIDQQVRVDAHHYQNVAEIVHDIKNPLSAMISCFSRIRKKGAGASSLEITTRRLETLESSAHRILEICDSLLGEYADDSLDDGSEKIVDVSDLIDEVYDLFTARAEERGIDFKVEVDDRFPNLKADPLNMHRALVNLVSNAIKFTPRGGKVEIRAEVDSKDNTVIMVVRDSGVGMTKLQIQQIADSHLTTVSPHGDVGTGLGLAIVNRIVIELGGTLEIDSTKNHGTSIRLHFPYTVSI